MACIKIAVANHKGGVGKTTTVVNLASGLAKKGYRVLIIDLDPQGHSSKCLNIDTSTNQTIAELLVEESIGAQNIVKSTYLDNLDILPSDSTLSMAELKISTMVSKDFRLRKALHPLNKSYDFMIIDTPPTFGTMILNAFSTADYLLVPVQLEFLSLEGVRVFLDAVKFTNKEINSIIDHSIQILGILITFYDNRTNISKSILESVEKNFGEIIFKNHIPNNVRIKESQARGVSIYDYDKKSTSAKAYDLFTDELLEKLGVRK